VIQVKQHAAAVVGIGRFTERCTIGQACGAKHAFVRAQIDPGFFFPRGLDNAEKFVTIGKIEGGNGISLLHCFAQKFVLIRNHR
jgi:hypothetical protein